MNVLINLGRRWVPAVRQQRLADRDPLSCDPPAACFELV